MHFFKECAKGIAIGTGAILPGVSSGVLCVIFGIYEKLLDAVLSFFKKPKENIKFLLPIFLGALIGIIIFSKILNYLLFNYTIQTKSMFIGLILGSIPSLIKQVNKKEKFKLRNILYMIITFSIGLSMVFIENNMPEHSVETVNFAYLMLSGFFMSLGVVIPGVSSTVILMLMGVYTIYLQSIANMYFPILIPIAMGLIIGGFIFMKLTKILLEKFYASTLYGIIGFSIGSTLVLIPELVTTNEVIISIMCIICGAMIVREMSKC